MKKSADAPTLRSQGGPDETYRTLFLDHGLRHGRSFGSKTGYITMNPRSAYIPNACIYTHSGACCWRGDLDLSTDDDQQGLIEVSRRLRRRLYVLREQTSYVGTMSQARLAKEAAFAVWRGKVTAFKAARPDIARVISDADSASGRARFAAIVRRTGAPMYRSVPGHPGLFVETATNGRERVGRFINRQFRALRRERERPRAG